MSTVGIGPAQEGRRKMNKSRHVCDVYQGLSGRVSGARTRLRKGEYFRVTKEFSGSDERIHLKFRTLRAAELEVDAYIASHDEAYAWVSIRVEIPDAP